MRACPFCRSKSTVPRVEQSQGMKYGYIVCLDCFARGPEIRTNYDFDEDAEWYELAENKWDERS
jgi:hypothetical protein